MLPPRSFLTAAFALALGTGFPTGGGATAQEAPPPLGDDLQLDGNAQILTRGPVHEAFAEPYSLNAQSSVVIAHPPPEPIDELPPEVMPAGDNVEWISGYWAWDDDRSDFIWISGVWRDVPPGQRWVPGSWVAVAGGFQWTAGFWIAEETEEIAYLPQPPESQELGPNAPAPDDNHFWVPGTWRYVSVDYSWQPGYWAPAQPDWCWIPAHYVWTPYGFVYCDGYWDYDVMHRGVLFSPVYFPAHQYVQYVPRSVVSVGPLMIHLFVRPQYNHYYFGDYYDDQYVNIGIVPWIGVQQHSFYNYDPLFAYYQTGLFDADGGGSFLSRVSGWHQYYRRNRDFRPRHTWSESRAFMNQRRGDRNDQVIRQASLTRSLAEFRRAEDRDVELRDVPPQRREQFRERSQDFRRLEKLRAERRDDGARQDDRRLALPKVERRQRRNDLPERPDRERDRSRQAGRPELSEEPRRDGRRDDAPNQERSRDRRTEPKPELSPDRSGRERSNDRNRANSGRQPETPPGDGERKAERRGRTRTNLPDAPEEGRQDRTPIPRPTEAPRPSEQRGREQRRQTRETRRPNAPDAESQNRNERGSRPAEPRRDADPTAKRNANPSRGPAITPPAADARRDQRDNARRGNGGGDRGRSEASGDRSVERRQTRETRRPNALDAESRGRAERGSSPADSRRDADRTQQRNVNPPTERDRGRDRNPPQATERPNRPSRGPANTLPAGEATKNQRDNAGRGSGGGDRGRSVGGGDRGVERRGVPGGGQDAPPEASGGRGRGRQQQPAAGDKPAERGSEKDRDRENKKRDGERRP